MHKYEIIARVDGRRMVVTIAAQTANNARQLLRAQYAGQHVSIFSTRRID